MGTYTLQLVHNYPVHVATFGIFTTYIYKNKTQKQTKSHKNTHTLKHFCHFLLHVEDIWHLELHLKIISYYSQHL